MEIDLDSYINVYNLMMLDMPRCRLSRPKMKPRVIVNDGEFLPLIDGSTGEIMR
jgi:hypothetical protein